MDRDTFCNANFIIFIKTVFLFVVVVANSNNTRPIYYGNKIHLLCSYEKPISDCRFIMPGESLEIQLIDDENSSGKYQYFGKGLQVGECGITINNATKENVGLATCILSDYNGNQQSETVEVKIFDYDNLHMGLPKLKILTSGPLKVSQTLTAECIVKSADEYSNVSWMLNDRVLKPLATNRNKNGLTYEHRSVLKYQIGISDNGSTLKCRTKVSNQSQQFIDSTFDLVVVNDTNLVHIGSPYDLSIKFFAYPRVLASRWRVNKRIIYYGVATSEFISKELKYLGNRQWEAVLRITNVTESNIHYNYTLQVDDKNGTKIYDVRLDDYTEVDAEEENDSVKIDETTTVSVPLFNISENTITSSPELPSTKQNRQHYQPQQKGDKSNTFLRRRSTTTTSSHSSSTTSTHPSGTERRTKYIRKQQKNTSISIAEMTSVISTTTTEPSSMIVSSITKEYTTETGIVHDENSLKNEYKNNNEENTTFGLENELKEIDMTTTSRNLIETSTNSDGIKQYETIVERFFIRISFIVMTLVIALSLFLVCHYRHQVTLLKNEIIQMNLENYYNQSCLYPSNFNDYSSTNFQQNDVGPFFVKRPLDIPNNSSSDSDVSSNQLLSTYSTNSHLYQSIDVYDIENHVYDEIMHAKEGDEDKPNNYENNESFSNADEMLIPSHCRTLMTIHEDEELEASQIQILSNLESTYI